MKDDDLDSLDLEEQDDAGEADEPAPVSDLLARRRLEEKLEERRLAKLIQDYDFDLDDTA
ncbi:MAG: hypothetical protein KatS3mg124_0865 [Porticoccaceae bacterium]|nr:MAG: hypothetical protein KatS3mg124_0865 [Porticoccaceae bacterium]